MYQDAWYASKWAKMYQTKHNIQKTRKIYKRKTKNIRRSIKIQQNMQIYQNELLCKTSWNIQCTRVREVYWNEQKCFETLPNVPKTQQKEQTMKIVPEHGTSKCMEKRQKFPNYANCTKTCQNVQPCAMKCIKIVKKLLSKYTKNWMSVKKCSEYKAHKCNNKCFKMHKTNDNASKSAKMNGTNQIIVKYTKEHEMYPNAQDYTKLQKMYQNAASVLKYTKLCE